MKTKKKSFFKERTISKIRGLKTSKAFQQRGLVERIDGLGSNSEGLILNCQITPGKFFINARNSRHAARRCFRSSDSYLKLEHPLTKRECFESSTTPLQLRQEAIFKLSKIPEDQNNYLGFFTQLTWGDRMKRFFPFVWNAEALRLFSYSENSSNDKIGVNIYPNARRVKQEGASAVLRIPSRTRGVDEYQFKLQHAPFVRSQNNLSSVLSLRPELLINEKGKLVRSGILHEDYNIRYTRETEASNVITFYPHQQAGYMGIIKEGYKTYNLTPLEMNPFIIFSKEGIKFYKKLCNNVLVYDPKLNHKVKLRKPRINEKSILLSRKIGKSEPNEIAYWDPVRDGKLKNYNWGFS